MKRAIYLVVLAVGILVASAIPAAASHIAEGVNKVVVTLTNPTLGTLIHGQAPFILSSQTLIDGAYMDDDALNVSMQDGTAHTGFMPGTGMVAMLSCFNESAADETTDCNDVGTNDITFPTADTKVFEFAADNQFNTLHIDTGTAAVATWTVAWEYWDGSAYVALDNVQDGTSGFTLSGVRKVKWDFPDSGLWVSDTLHSVTGYWVQAHVTAFTSITTLPLGDQVWYETGRWWALADSLEQSEEKQLDLQLDVTDGDATTVVFASTLSAGEVLGTDTSYPPAYDANGTTAEGECEVERTLSGSDYTIRNCLMLWDTSALPEPIEVTAASITCDVGSASATARTLQFEWFSQAATSANRLYTTIAQGNAHSGTALSTVAAASEYTFNLDNLYRIQPGGRTGVRGHVSGGVPAEANAAALTGCDLSVTYTPLKQSHYFFPSPDGGFTLPDAAALEPGGEFSITIAGFFAMTPGVVLFSKGTSAVDLKGHVSLSERLTLTGGGGAVVTTVILNNEYHVIDIIVSGTGNGARTTYLVDGVELTQVVNFTAGDNATDWTFGFDNAIPYMDYLVLEIGNVDTVIYQMRDLPGYQLEDHTGNGHDVTAHFPDTIDTYTVSLGPVTPNASASSAGAGAGVDVQGASPEVTNYSDADTSSSGGFFLFDIMSDVAGSSGFPYQAMTSIFALGVTLMVGIVIAVIFKEALPVGLGIVITMVIFWQMGALPGWMPVLFSIGPLVFFLIWKKANP